MLSACCAADCAGVSGVFCTAISYFLSYFLQICVLTLFSVSGMLGYSQSVLPVFLLKFGALRGIFSKNRRPSCDYRLRCRLKRAGNTWICPWVVGRFFHLVPRFRAFRKSVHRRVQLGFKIRVLAAEAGFTHDNYPSQTVSTCRRHLSSGL